MTAHNCEDCSDNPRITQIEKDLVKVQTQTKYIDSEIVELKQSIKDCTEAINALSNKISAQENHTKTAQWFVMFIVGAELLGHFI